jgi:hypothetical protein
MKKMNLFVSVILLFSLAVPGISSAQVESESRLKRDVLVLQKKLKAEELKDLLYKQWVANSIAEESAESIYINYVDHPVVSAAVGSLVSLGLIALTRLDDLKFKKIMPNVPSSLNVDPKLKVAQFAVATIVVGVISYSILSSLDVVKEREKVNKLIEDKKFEDYYTNLESRIVKVSQEILDIEKMLR